MRQALAIASRDLRATYASAFGVGCTAAFAGLSGVLLVFDLRGNQARLDLWFSFLFVALGLLAALLSLRSFAEEERAGTLELVLTSPVRYWQVALGKLLGVLGVLAVVIAATVACPLLVASMGKPDAGPVLTGYAGLVLLGAGFLAVGLAVSAATANPCRFSTKYQDDESDLLYYGHRYLRTTTGGWLSRDPLGLFDQ